MTTEIAFIYDDDDALWSQQKCILKPKEVHSSISTDNVEYRVKNAMISPPWSLTCAQGLTFFCCFILWNWRFLSLFRSLMWLSWYLYLLSSRLPPSPHRLRINGISKSGSNSSKDGNRCLMPFTEFTIMGGIGLYMSENSGFCMRPLACECNGRNPSI